VKPQVWFCEVCRALGAVMYEEHADAMSVMYQVLDAHQEASPSCKEQPRILVLDNVTKDEIWMRGLPR